MKIKQLKGILVALLLLAGCGEVYAASVGGMYGLYWNMNHKKRVSLYHGGRYLGKTDAGLINLRTHWYAARGEGKDIHESAGPSWQVPAFSFDIFQQASPCRWRYYNVVEPIDGPSGGKNNKLFPNGIGQEKADDISRLYTGHYAEVKNKDTAVAFQLSLWEIIYEDKGKYNVSKKSGDFYTATKGKFTSLANDWLSNLSSVSASSKVRVLSDNQYQDYSVYMGVVQGGGGGGGGGAVPEPITMFSMAAGIGGIYVYLRKRRKSKSMQAKLIEQHM
ncbi:MAG: PEP-CTERM sorting domain-containing protein [Phycisphaerae bacterium]|nr:PEP-CTERM sorting domain-containing protein [Phycisphaerae bacterium]